MKVKPWIKNLHIWETGFVIFISWCGVCFSFPLPCEYAADPFLAFGVLGTGTQHRIIIYCSFGKLGLVLHYMFTDGIKYWSERMSQVFFQHFGQWIAYMSSTWGLELTWDQIGIKSIISHCIYFWAVFFFMMLIPLIYWCQYFFHFLLFLFLVFKYCAVFINGNTLFLWLLEVVLLVTYKYCFLITKIQGEIFILQGVFSFKWYFQFQFVMRLFFNPFLKWNNLLKKVWTN